MKDLIIKKLDMQISHCKDCQDTDGQLKGFIRGLKHAKIIVADCVNEPTTAEMLLWLAENKSIDIWHTAMEGIIYVWRNGNAIKFEGKTLSEAIKQAYDWAIKEEQNAKN